MFFSSFFKKKDSGRASTGVESVGHYHLQHSIERLATNATQQSNAIHDTMASTEEMRAMLVQTDQHLGRSLALTDKAKSLGDERLKTVEKLQFAMDSIKDSNQFLIDLQSSFQAIKNKTRVINDIVFKTQLLSFNASIEAARAGQFGKGFAVVAEEVGRLAQTSGQAAKEIETLLVESQRRAVEVVKMVGSRADDGVAVVREVKSGFTELTQSISHISTGLMQMSEASREQLLGIEKATEAIGKINSLALENIKTTQEMLLSEPPDTDDQTDHTNVIKLIDDIVTNNFETGAVKDVTNLDADDSSFRSQN